MTLSLQYMSIGDYDVAEQNFLELLKMPLSTKDRATVLYDLGLIYLREQKFQQAVDTFNSIEFPNTVPQMFKETFLYDQSLALFLLSLNLIQGIGTYDQVIKVLDEALKKANDAIALTNNPSPSLIRLSEEILLKKAQLPDIFFRKTLKSASLQQFTELFSAYCKARQEQVFKIESADGDQKTKEIYLGVFYKAIKRLIDPLVRDLKSRLGRSSFSSKKVLINQIDDIIAGFSMNSMIYSLMRLEDLLLYVEALQERKDPIASFLYILQKRYANLKFLPTKGSEFLDVESQFLQDLLENKIQRLSDMPNKTLQVDKEISKTKQFLRRYQSESIKNQESIQNDIAYYVALESPIQDLFKEIFSDFLRESSQHVKEKLQALFTQIGCEIDATRDVHVRNDFALSQMRISNLEKMSSWNTENAKWQFIRAWSLCYPKSCLLELLKNINGQNLQNEGASFVEYISIANTAYRTSQQNDTLDFANDIKEMLINATSWDITKDEVLLYVENAANYLLLLDDQTNESLLLQVQNSYKRQKRLLDLIDQIGSRYFGYLKQEKSMDKINSLFDSFRNLKAIYSVEQLYFPALEKSLLDKPFGEEIKKKLKGYFQELIPLLAFSSSLDVRDIYSDIVSNKKNAARVMDIIKQIEDLLVAKTAKNNEQEPQKKNEREPQQEPQVEMPSFSISSENALKLLQEMQKEDHKVIKTQNFVPGLRPW